MEKKKINIKDLIIRIILIAIIVFLGIHNCNLLKTIRNNEKKTPTGNVDIFEILCDKDTCKVETNATKTNPTENTLKTNTTKKNNNTNTNTNNELEEEEEELEGFYVKDKQITWQSTNELRIFTNPMYGKNGTIAPEDTNVYQFVIKNNTDYDTTYSIEFIENNPHNLNMKYKLKKGDTYIVSDYSDYSALDQTDIAISKNSSDTYYLEWKWVGSSNDNDYADIDNAYDLSIDIKAETTDE